MCAFGLPEGEMRRLYRQLDSDMSGLLDRDELSTMMDVISNINKAKVVKMRAYWHLLALLFLLVLVIGVGMFAYAYAMGWTYADARAAKESEIPNFKGSYLGHFPLVSADFWTSDHLSERSRSVDAFSGTRARGTLTLKRH